MGVIRYKIWHELWANKARTMQVILTISMGAFAIGMIIGTRNLTISGVNEIWQTTSPASIALAVNPPIDDDLVTSLRHLDDIADVEGFSTYAIEWQPHPDAPWQPAGLSARHDYAKQRFTKLSLVRGNWPQGRTMTVEQGGDTAFDIQPGSQVFLRINNRVIASKIGGIVYNPVGAPPSFGGPAQFYTTRDRLAELMGHRNFNRILADMSSYEEAKAQALATQMQTKLEKQGIASTGATTFMTRTADPNKHFFQEILDGVFLVLGLMAGLALILGLFLVYNTVNATVSQQVNQIGVMKALGGTTGQILSIYLAIILAYGFLAAIIAIPLGIIGAWMLNSILLNFFNVAAGSFTVSGSAVLIQLVIALVAPLLAALMPIFSGVRITIREAISTYGLATGVGLLEALLSRLKRVSRLFLLTVSNTFRQKGRVFLTQVSLVLSGVIFMMVMGVRDAAHHTYGDVLNAILRFDMTFALAEAERIAPIEVLVKAFPGITDIEMWGYHRGQIRLADQPETDDDQAVVMLGVPLPTNLYVPQMRAGRWLHPDDETAVVINQKLAIENDIVVGDWIAFDAGLGQESQWQVVGTLFDPIVSESIHVPRKIMARTLGHQDKAETVWLQTDATVPASAFRQYLEHHQVSLAPQTMFGADTAKDITTQALNRISIIITLLGTMAVIIAVVGSVALSGVLSLNVLERRREIGVMRAIGSSSLVIARLFIGEGLILGLLSWLIAFPLSIPAAQWMARILGETVRTELVYHFTPIGALTWLIIIISLSIAASWLPARSATRISVQASLAYQ